MNGSTVRALTADRNRLLEAELPSLRRYARALASTSEDSNDLVQETVARALDKWPQWRGEGPLKSWLFAIMRNSFYLEARRRSRWRSVSMDAMAPEQEPRADHQRDPLLIRNVAAAFSRLSSEQRETMFLVAVEGLSYAETAAITNVAIGTVMSRLHRARAVLRSEADAQRGEVG